jgi:hypothetical protein
LGPAETFFATFLRATPTQDISFRGTYEHFELKFDLISCSTVLKNLRYNPVSSNVVWSNVIWSNVVWSNVVWSNVIWSNVVWSNVGSSKDTLV